MSPSTCNLRHSYLKSVDFDQYLLVTSERQKEAKNVQLQRIGNRPRAFQRAIDEVRTLPLTLPNDVSKNRMCGFFVNKIQVQSNKVCYKASLCENFQRESCGRTIARSNGVQMLAVNVHLFNPKMTHRFEQRPILTYQCLSRNCQQKCSIITCRKSTTSSSTS